MNEDKKKSLRAALDKIEKAHGREAIRRMGDEPPREISAVSTGSLGLDIALGIGGLPRGRVVEIYGPESSGKTTIALQTVAAAQKAGGLAAFVDAEHALDGDLRGKTGRADRGAPGLPAGQRRAGPRNRRHAGPLRLRGHRGG